MKGERGHTATAAVPVHLPVRCRWFLRGRDAADPPISGARFLGVGGGAWGGAGCVAVACVGVCFPTALHRDRPPPCMYSGSYSAAVPVVTVCVSNLMIIFRTFWRVRDFAYRYSCSLYCSVYAGVIEFLFVFPLLRMRNIMPWVSLGRRSSFALVSLPHFLH